MSILAMTGFETGNEPDEGIIVHDNPLTFSTNAAFQAPQSNGSTVVYVSPDSGYSKLLAHSVSECWLSALVNSYSASGDFALGFYKSPIIGSTATNREFVGVYSDNTTMRIRVGASTKTATFSVGVDTWRRIHIHITGRSAGDTVSVYVGGDLTTPVLEHTLDATDAAALSAGDFDHMYFMAGQSYLDDIYAIDPNDGVGLTNINRAKALSVVLRRPIANGADYTFSTGTYADLDETPTNLNDYVEATAVGQVLDLEFEDLDPAQVVGAIEIIYRTQLAASTAGDKFDISIDDGTTNNVLHTNVTIPGDAYVRRLLHEAADGGSLEVSKVNASTIKAVTKS